MLWKSPYPDASIPEASLTSVVLERAAALGDKPALVEGVTGRRISYAELTEGVRRVARGLADRGFAPGDVLGLYSPNLPEYALAVFAVASLGGTVTTVNPLYTVDELAHQLEDARARVLITAPPFVERARAATSRTGVKEVFVFGEADGALPFASLLRSNGEPPAVRIAPREQVAVLPYSSGTTGLPKGVMLTHHNLVSNIFQCAGLEDIRENDVAIAVLPFFHIYGLSVLLNMVLHHGCTLVTLPRFELEGFLKALQDHRVTRAYLVPPIILGLAKHPVVDKFDLRSLRCINSGAAPLGADVQGALATRLRCIVKQGYGLTETSPVTHLSPDDRVRLGASGLPIRNTECRIVEPLTGADLAAGERGEVWVRGPQVMKGYLNDPGATRATITSEGWLRTGDIGYVDADGFLFVVDRLKELIKYKGMQVAPAELEALLLAHPAVADAAVIGSPDAEAGEVPKAFVVLKVEATPEALMGFVAERVAPHKKIRKLEIVEQIPKSPSGKILRRLLVERERGAGAQGPMSNVVRYEATHRVAVLTVDNPPVNALGPGVLEAIEEAIARGLADPLVDALVLMGAGQTFVAGADINVFKTVKTREQSLERSQHTHARLLRMEDASKPLVAAVHGTALGGGLELAMACHYRVATADARLGQPEVTLGIIPGAGGTQRLPRLAGAAMALEMCTEGKPVSAPQAQASGIVDRVVSGDLRQAAIAFAGERAGQVRKTREQGEKIADRDAGLAACVAVRTALGKTARGARAPFLAVDAIEAALTLDFDAGSARERELFADCVVSTESRALVHLFFAEREAAKVPDVPKETKAREILRAAVVGAGTMGGGIAMAYANAGIPVLLKEVDSDALQRGLATIRRNYEASVAKGKMTANQVDHTLALITPTTSYDAFDAADLVVEAVFESMDLKKSTFADLGRVTRADCVLASNTSTLDLDELARASGRPAQVIGHHFFSPANVMKLLEIVRGHETSRETIATSLKLAKRLGKVGVVVGNCFGFVANRMLAYYMREAYLLLEEGASVPQIDGALTEFGMPVGPYGMQDIAGIDVGARIRQHLKSIGKTRAEGPQSEVPDRLYEMGRYGQKTGAGWYRYEPGSRARIPDPLADQLAEEAARRRGITRRRISDEEIVARIMTALANEGARVLEEGYAIRAGDIDVIYCHGFGFPRHRGGPMFYADTVGLTTVLARVREYRGRLGDHWAPAPLLERLAAAAGRGFYGEAS